jgi:hypothetical protein
LATVIDEQHQAGAAIKALQLDDFGQCEVKLRGLKELIEPSEKVGVVGGGVTSESDAGLMAENLVTNGVDVTARDAVGVKGLEFGFG